MINCGFWTRIWQTFLETQKSEPVALRKTTDSSFLSITKIKLSSEIQNGRKLAPPASSLTGSQYLTFLIKSVLILTNIISGIV